MAILKACLSVSFSCLLLCTASIAQNLQDDTSSDANHIFNALHSSLRQFGSSLKHNGMSMFLASVPADTQLYHGNGSPNPVIGMEWLAFEPEHATMFAAKLDAPHHRPPQNQNPLLDSPLQATDRQSVMQMLMEMEGDERPRIPHIEPGWLHTFRTKHQLRLVYIDGMSAGKTRNGTLDFEDFLVLRANKTFPDMWDVERGHKLCDIAAKEWKGRVDGFMRMECGFEVILCDFERHLDVVHVNRVKNSSLVAHEADRAGSFFSLFRAISDRFDGIGRGRAIIHHDRFVTAFGRGLDLFDGAKLDQPRLVNVDAQEMNNIRSEIDELIADSPAIFNEVDHWTDWQAVVDLIVSRYSSRLTYMASPPMRANDTALHAELDRALAPFIDYSSRDTSAEIDTCTAHFLPAASHLHTSQAFEAASTVSRRICTALFTALSSSTADSVNMPQSPRDILDGLMTWLDWSTWKACGPCAANELCSIPIWPFGSRADHERPSCRNASEAWRQHGYWG